MIEIKRVELRDAATTIPALALRVRGGADDPILWHAGFGESYKVILLHLEGMMVNYDPFSWSSRTMHHAHLWLEQSENWATIEDRAQKRVVDVQFILGETPSPKSAEIVERAL